MDMSSLAIILLLASKFDAIESLENFTNSLGGLCQHGLDWDPSGQLNLLW
jgi:hypothetical protein